MEADDILKGQEQLNRHLYQQKIVDAVEAMAFATLPTAYKAFDAQSGLARLENGNGNIFYGSAQTNGAVGKGENIRLRRGGVLAGYDAMPHKKSPHHNEQIINKPYKVKTLFYLHNPDGINFDVYVGGDRFQATKILSIGKAGLNTVVDSSLVVGGITNLGKQEMVSTRTRTNANGSFLLRKAGRIEQIIVNPSTGYTYLGDGAWEGSATGTERSMIYDFHELILPYQTTSNFVYPVPGFGSLHNTEIDTSFSTWTPDRLTTECTSTKEVVSKSATLNPAGTRIDGVDASFESATEGYFLIQKAANGWITQEFLGTATDHEALTRIYYSNYTSGIGGNYLGGYSENKQYENKNILRYFQNNQDPIILNNGDFFVINVDTYPDVIAQDAITKDSTTFTIIYPNTPQVIYYGGYGPSQSSILFLLFSETGGDSLQKFDPSNISGNVLFNWFVDGKLGLIKGKVESVLYSPTTTELRINFEISSITPNTTTSFPKKLISDNGSFYSYFFRNSIQSIANKSILPLLPLSPLLTYNNLLKGALSYISKYDNFVGNKIYSVVQTYKKKAYIEQWNISNNGDVNFSKIFETDYFPIDTTGAILGHSYHR